MKKNSLKLLKKKILTLLNLIEIEDHFFETQLNDFIDKNNLNFEVIQSPMFITSRLDFENFVSSQKKIIRMASFYQKIRQKLSILTDEDNKPIGGKWSFDEENRKKIPKTIEIPSLPINQKDNEFKSLKSKIDHTFHEHPGSLDYLWMPTNRKDSLEWLDLFLENKFSKFGDYEDAIRFENNFLFHSALSPVLNMGLINSR